MSWSKHVTLPQGTPLSEVLGLIRAVPVTGDVHEKVEKASEMGTLEVLAIIESGNVPSLEVTSLNVQIFGHHNRDDNPKGNSLSVSVAAPY